jgi:hypothetical protein
MCPSSFSVRTIHTYARQILFCKGRRRSSALGTVFQKKKKGVLASILVAILK